VNSRRGPFRPVIKLFMTGLYVLPGRGTRRVVPSPPPAVSRRRRRRTPAPRERGGVLPVLDSGTSAAVRLFETGRSNRFGGRQGRGGVPASLESWGPGRPEGGKVLKERAADRPAGGGFGDRAFANSGAGGPRKWFGERGSGRALVEDPPQNVDSRNLHLCQHLGARLRGQRPGAVERPAPPCGLTGGFGAPGRQDTGRARSGVASCAQTIRGVRARSLAPLRSAPGRTTTLPYPGSAFCATLCWARAKKRGDGATWFRGHFPERDRRRSSSRHG